jgi:TolB-like protein/DNA-binding winged helix-turn-helix (wHTH) protein/Flp pilus assembly protein TadD
LNKHQSHPKKPGQAFILGPWRVEPDRNAIVQGDEERHLENRVMQTLVFLAEHQGHPVSREQFFDSVWRGLVVNEEALSRAISLLRAALDDNASSPKFIQTIPGVGYRLIAEVEKPEPAADGDRAVGEAGDQPAPAFSLAKKLQWLAAAAAFLALAYFALDRLVLEPEVQPGSGEAAAVPEQGNSLVVLPFVNMSTDPEQEFFADGMTEEILNLLAGISNLRVTARTSSFFFKGRNLPVSNIAETLNVQHVLEGSVRKSGNRIRITAQLIEAETDRHIWSKTFDRELEDIFEIQDEVAGFIADALVDSFDGLEPRQVSRTSSLAAFEAYRTGRLLWWRRSAEDLRAAIDLFEKAIENDPGFAPAYAAVGDSWLLLVLYGKVQIIDGVDQARPMIEKALELDPDSPEALAARGLSRLIVGDKDEAEKDLRHAIELDHEYIPAYAWLSALLGDLGRVPEQGAVLQQALARDPLNKVLTSNYATNLQARGDSEGGKELLRALLRMQPEFPTLLVDLSGLELSSGALVEAWDTARRAYAQAPEDTMVILAMAKVWMELGAFREAEEVLLAGRAVAPRNVNIKLEHLKLLMLEGRVAEAARLKDNLFPEDISWLPDAIQRTYHQQTGFLHLVKEEWPLARDHLELALNPAETKLYDDDQVITLTFVALLHRGMGDEELAEQRLQMAERVIGHARVNGIEDAASYYQVACIFALRGDKQRALHALQEAYDKGWRQLWALDIDGRLDLLREEPAFQKFRDLLAGDVATATEEIRVLRAAAGSPSVSLVSPN